MDVPLIGYELTRVPDTGQMLELLVQGCCCCWEPPIPFTPCPTS